MSWPRGNARGNPVYHYARYDRARFRMCLLVLACVAGLVAFGSTLSALVALQEVQTIIELLRSPAGADWTQFGFDATATRNNPAETHITAANVTGLRLRWRLKLPDIADSTPAFLHGLRFPNGRTRDVLYLTTRTGSLVAVDADSAVVLWQQVNLSFDPNQITTSSPVADADHSAVYSYGIYGQ